MFLPKNKTCNIAGLGVVFIKAAGSYENDSMLLNTKTSYE